MANAEHDHDGSQEVVRAVIEQYHGATNDEIQVLTGFKQGAVSGAVTRLQFADLVMDSGERRPGIDPRSKAQTVWVLGPGRERALAYRRRKLAKFPTEWLRDEIERREA